MKNSSIVLGIICFIGLLIVGFTFSNTTSDVPTVKHSYIKSVRPVDPNQPLGRQFVTFDDNITKVEVHKTGETNPYSVNVQKDTEMNLAWYEYEYKCTDNNGTSDWIEIF